MVVRRLSILSLSLVLMVLSALPGPASEGGGDPEGLRTTRVADPGRSTQQPEATEVAPSTVGGPGPASTGQWYDGDIWQDWTVNCLHGYTETLGSSFVSWYGTLGQTPRVGDVYYIRAWWQISGYPCGGGAYVHLEFGLPAHTQLAITAQNPVRCFYRGPSQSNFSEFTSDCPQSPGSGWHGGPSFNPPGGSSWPTASTAAFQIWVPVKSTQALNGLLPGSGQPCTSCLYAPMWLIDGVNSPWYVPRVPVRVEGTGSPATPWVGYEAPSVRNNQFNPSTNKTSAETWALVYTEGTSGKGWFDFGTTTSYGQRSEGDLSSGNWLVWETWNNLTPGTKYHFRACYRPTGGTRVCGQNQSFTAASGPDTTPPNTSIKSGPKGFVSSTKAHFVFGSNESGVAYLCSLDGTAFSICPAGKPTYSGLSQGKHTLRVQARDAAGNQDSTPATRSWTVDTIKPDTKIIAGPSGRVRSSKATFKFRSDEANSTFQCRLDGSSFTGCASPKTYTSLGRGKHTFEVRARDRAGNLDGSPAVRSWRVA